MSEEQTEPFAVNIGNLKTRPKDSSTGSIAASDLRAEEKGFASREARRKPGRQPSPRTGQVHAKVYPAVAQSIANEAIRRGVQQGVIIEEAWALYEAEKGL